jgi:uncharacterized delta-60 repeat protein
MKLTACFLSIALALSCGITANAQISVRPPATGVPGKVARFTLQNWSFAGPFDVRSVAVQPDRKVVIAGKFRVNVPVSVDGLKILVLNNIIRLNENGSLDPTFIIPEALETLDEAGTFDSVDVVEWGPNATVHSAVVNSSDGDFDLVFGGDFTAYGKINPADAPSAEIRNRMLSLTRDGELGDTIPSEEGFNGAVRHLFRNDANDIIATGDFTTYDGAAAGFGGRFSTAGSISMTWPANADASINSAIRSGDGTSVYVGGNFTIIGGFPATRLARLALVDGTPDNTFDVIGAGTAPNDEVLALAGGGVGSDLVLVGKFTQMGATAKGRIAALTATGTLDATFPAANNGNSNGALGGDIKSITRLPDGRYVIAGSFTSYNGITAFGLARLEPDGSLDTTFATPLEPTTGGDIRHVSTSYSGDPFASIVFARYYVSGSFTKFSGAGGIAAINGGRYPVILTQPTNTVSALGDPTNLNAVASDNFAGLTPMDTLSYQWQKNGKDIYGANAAFLNIPFTSASDAGTYRVVISNTLYSVVSNPVTLSVVNPFVGIIPSSGFRASGRIDSAAINFDLGGNIAITVNSLGTASGTLTMAGPGGRAVKHKFTGQFNSSGQLMTTIARRNMSPLYLELNMDFTGAPTDFDLSDGTSTISDGVSTAVISAWNNRWNSTTLSTAFAGSYNIGLETSALDLAATVPVGMQVRPVVSQGFGFIRMTVGTSKGDVRMSGTLADGSTFSASSVIWGDANGTVPLWIPIYKSKGSLNGELTINTALPDNPVGGNLEWNKPSGLTKIPDFFGFMGVQMTTSASSGRYNPLLAIVAAPPGNLLLTFDDGIWTPAQAGLSAPPLAQAFSVVGSSTVPDAPVLLGMSAKTSTSSGLITGKFTDGLRPVKFQALILTQGATAIRGNFQMPNTKDDAQYWIGGSVQ